MLNPDTSTFSCPDPIPANPSPPTPNFATSSPYPLSKLRCDECFDTSSDRKDNNLGSRKRFCKEIGKIGRNTRQKILCGLFTSCQALGKQKEGLCSKDNGDQGNAKSVENLGNSANPCVEERDGFGEADPIKLPKQL